MLRLLMIIIVSCGASGATAADVRQITWGDLLPEIVPLAHPLVDVDQSVREDLARVARVEIEISQGFLAADSETVTKTNAMIEARLSEGVDLRALEEMVQAHRKELDRRQGLMNASLDGEIVRMPGYALPLEFSPNGATELFLVPFVGACIHVPPPPPNQIVSISLETPLTLAGMFEPVWVTGRLIIEESTQSLSLVDGVADIPYGYRLTNVKVEPYN
ncbi:MAG: DUF3299 domain-containing protein [Pseudomonadota bacterium]